jgi:hypothetical protein
MNATAHTFAIIAIIATAVQLGALVALHVLPTGYSPVTDAVSDYGVGRYRSVFWLQVVAGGVAGVTLAIGLNQLSPFAPTLAVAMLILSSVARFFIPFFPTDQNGSRFQTVPGTIHMLLAVVSFGGIAVAAGALWSTLMHYPAWFGVQTALNVLNWVILGSLIALVLGLRPEFRLHQIVGLFERLFYLSSLTWFFIVAIDLARISG